jgi:hypothetical protein
MEAEMKEYGMIRGTKIRLVSFEGTESEVKQLTLALLDTVGKISPDNGAVIISACLSILASLAAACPTEELPLMRDGVLNAMSTVFDHIENKQRREAN